MKKRSSIEIKIRNALSEILILSLKCSEESVLLYLIFRFCQFVDKKGKIRLTDLLEHRENIDWVRLNWAEISEKLSSLHIFEIDSENCIRIERRFENFLPYICIRVKRYWEFISDLYSRGEEFKCGIEGEIKRGILLFNEGFYFECHEFLEEVWRKEKGKERSFLHGLIHSAVAFYHMEHKNYRGAVSYIKRGYIRLQGFEPVFLGVDIKTFLADMGNYLVFLEKSSSNNVDPLKSAVPKIGLME